jgi:hypothetical protein
VFAEVRVARDGAEVEVPYRDQPGGGEAGPA